MRLNPAERRDVPEDTQTVAKAAFPKGNVYLWLRDNLGELYSDRLFNNLYPVHGQPSLSPGQLALVSVMQFMEGLTDRQAADAVRARIDWKYALSLPLTDPGFDFSALSEFRQRLSRSPNSQAILDTLLAELKQRGWLKARGKQGTDSTHVLAAIRTLNRLEMVGEAMRRALNELAETDPAWLQTIAPSEWYARYAQQMDGLRLPKEATKRQALIETIGRDGLNLMHALLQAPAKADLRELAGVEILRQMWVQQYWLDYPQGDEQFHVHLRADDNQPAADKRIHSPYDVECRYCKKRATEWVGYKVHLTETCEDDTVHLITNVETTSAVEQDVSATERIHAALAAKDLLPDEHLLDSGYIDAELLVTAKVNYGLTICGPVKKDVRWQANTADGLGLSEFNIDWQAKSVTCPQGHTSNYWKDKTNIYKQPAIQVRFAEADCHACPVQAQCTRSTRGIRHLQLMPQAHYEALQTARHEQQTPEFWQRYAKRSGIEGTISQGVRAFDVRFSRYIGLIKTQVQMVFTATAMNVYRLFNWAAEVPHALTRIGHFASLAPEPSLIAGSWRA